MTIAVCGQCANRFCQGRDRFDDVFAVVEDQEQPFVADDLRNGFRCHTFGSRRQPERARHCHRHKRGIRQSCQFDQPAAVGEFSDDAASDFQGEAGFADAAGSGQRHDTIGGNKIAQLHHRRLAANETSHGSGNIGHR